jgi:hypothetical protein
MFELTVINNWHIIAQGFVSVSTPWAVIYFIIFNIISSIMILNIVVAFILEVFQLQFDIESAKSQHPFQARLNDLTDR